MSEELLARIDQLESQLAEARSAADRALDTARNALDLAEQAETRADDAAGEASYQRDAAERAILRVNEGLIDIQGVNLEQRITQVLSDRIADGTFNTVVVQTAPAPEQPPRQRIHFSNTSPGIWDRPIQFDVIGTDGVVATGGTHPVVQSEQSVPADVGTGYVARNEQFDVAALDEVAGQSETDSAEALDENY